MLEYGLIVGLVSLSIMVTLGSMGDALINDVFGVLTGQMNNASQK